MTIEIDPNCAQAIDDGYDELVGWECETANRSIARNRDGSYSGFLRTPVMSDGYFERRGVCVTLANQGDALVWLLSAVPVVHWGNIRLRPVFRNSPSGYLPT